MFFPVDALNALKRVQAKTEVGVTYIEYGKQLGDSWGDVKIFVESPEGKEFSDLSDHMRTAIAQYKTADEAWKKKLDGNGTNAELQEHWKRADLEIKVLDSALNQQ